MTIRGKRRLHTANLIMITTLSTFALALDGLQIADVIIMAATIIWLWEVPLKDLEERLIDTIKGQS